MSAPVLGLLVAGSVPPALEALLLQLAGRWQVRALTADDHADAWLLLDHDGSSPAGPSAVWVRDAEDSWPSASVLLSDQAAVVAALPPGRALLVPGDADLCSPLMPPFVRSRLRASRGLPDELVLEAQDGRWSTGGVALAEELVDIALQCCAAAAVTGPADLERALRASAPTVTDEATARAVGATPGVEVLVAPTEVLRVSAVTLAAEESSAARLARHGHSLMRGRTELAAVATSLSERLAAPPADPLAGPLREVAALGTPAGSRVVDRVLAATAPLRQPAWVTDAGANERLEDLRALLGAPPAVTAAPRPSTKGRTLLKGALRRAIVAGAPHLAEDSAEALREVRRLQHQLDDPAGHADKELSIRLELLASRLTALEQRYERPGTS